MYFDFEKEHDSNHSSKGQLFQNEISPWKKVTLADFKVIKKIGSGGYGSVYLAHKRTSGEKVAIKVMNKMDILNQNCLNSVQIEKIVLGLNN